MHRGELRRRRQLSTDSDEAVYSHGVATSSDREWIAPETLVGAISVAFGVAIWWSIALDVLRPPCGVNIGLALATLSAPIFLLLAAVATGCGAWLLHHGSRRGRTPLLLGLLGLALCGLVVFAPDTVSDAVERATQLAGLTPERIPGC